MIKMPFWVVTKYEKRIGFSGNEATGVVLVNAQTGIKRIFNCTTQNG
jgi:hypothetical protein